VGTLGDAALLQPVPARLRDAPLLRQVLGAGRAQFGDGYALHPLRPRRSR
jgi:hypothetical protein